MSYISQPGVARQILRLPEVIIRTGMKKSWIYKEIAARPPRFPRPVKIGRASGWDAAAIDAWIAARLSGAAFT